MYFLYSHVSRSAIKVANTRVAWVIHKAARYETAYMKFTKRSLITTIFNTSFLITSLSEKHLKYYLLMSTSIRHLQLTPGLEKKGGEAKTIIPCTHACEHHN